MSEQQLSMNLAMPLDMHPGTLSPRDIWLRMAPKYIHIFKEDNRVEYKASNKKIHFDELAEYYSMFSNTVEGGVIIHGVSNDGKIIGCASLSQDQLNRIDSFHTTSCPEAFPEHKRIPIDVDSKPNFLIATFIPYRGHLIETSNGDAFIRYGESKHKLSPEERQDFRSTRHERSYELMESPLNYPHDFDATIIDEFCKNFRERERKDTWTNEEILIDRLLLEKSGIKLNPRNALALMAAKNPRMFIPGCRVRVQRFASIEEGTGVDFSPIRDTYIEGNIVDILTRAQAVIESLNYDVTWLNRDGKFITTSEYPQWAWFEALVNACVHRSYSFSGTEVTIKFFSDRLEVESPGGFVPPVNSTNIYSQRASRNPHLMEALRYLGFVRMTREGTRRMRESMIEWNLAIVDMLKLHLVVDTRKLRKALKSMAMSLNIYRVCVRWRRASCMGKQLILHAMRLLLLDPMSASKTRDTKGWCSLVKEATICSMQLRKITRQAAAKNCWRSLGHGALLQPLPNPRRQNSI